MRREGYVENYKIVLKELQEDDWEPAIHIHGLACSQAISEQPTDLMGSVSGAQQLSLILAEIRRLMLE